MFVKNYDNTLSRNPFHLNLRDLITLAFIDIEAKAVESEALTDLRDHPGFVKDQPSDRCIFLVRQLPIKFTVQVTDRHGTVYQQRTVLQLAHAGDIQIVLIINLANNFLQNILQCHNPHQRAIFINDNREMLFTLAKGLQLFIEIGGLRHEPWI